MRYLLVIFILLVSQKASCQKYCDTIPELDYYQDLKANISSLYFRCGDETENRRIKIDSNSRFIITKYTKNTGVKELATGTCQILNDHRLILISLSGNVDTLDILKYQEILFLIHTSQKDSFIQDFYLAKVNFSSDPQYMTKLVAGILKQRYFTRI